MKIKVNSIRGFEDAFIAMYISKRSWTPELDADIRETCNMVLGRNGTMNPSAGMNDIARFNEWLSMALKMGRKHITILRYIDISIMTEGIHRAGQDDIDSHAKRFDNRIIRSSTRLAEYSKGEMSDYYKDKIISTEEALDIMGMVYPPAFNYNGKRYVKTTNGYIDEEYVNNKDVKRGLYMLSIPSNFISKINLCEWGHVFKERNADGGANPEVKEWAEEVMRQINDKHPLITRDYVLSINN